MNVDEENDADTIDETSNIYSVEFGISENLQPSIKSSTLLDNVRWVSLVWRCFGENSKLSRVMEELFKLITQNLMYRLSALIQRRIMDKKTRKLVFTMDRKEYDSNGSYHDITWSHEKDLECLDKTISLLKSKDYYVNVNIILHEHKHGVYLYHDSNNIN